jgi:hypothetical protein
MNILYGTQVALIILFLLATMLFILPQNKKNRELHQYLILFFYIALVVIAVTRPETTADTDNYISDFKTGQGSSRLEPMYFIIIKIAQLFSNPVLVGFSIFALLSVTPRFHFIKQQSINIWASVMVYMSYCYIAQDIIAIRSAFASALVLYVIHFKLENKTIPMVATILIATLFHYAALLFFVLLLVNPNKEHRLKYIALLVGSYGLYFSGFDIRTVFPYLKYLTFLEYNLTDYSMSTAEVYGTLNGPQILRLTTCLLFWLFSGKLKESNPYAIIYLKVFTISLCMFPIFSLIPTMGYRTYEMFASAEVVGLPIMFMGVFKKRWLNRAAIIIYTFYFFFVSITSIAYWAPF